METVRREGKIVYLLLAEGGQEYAWLLFWFPVCVNCEVELRFLLE